MKNLLNHIIIGILLFYTASLSAAPSAELWPLWAEHNAQSTQTISHDIWDKLLNRYVSEDQDGINRFAYKALSDADRLELRLYLSSLGRHPHKPI